MKLFYIGAGRPSIYAEVTELPGCAADGSTYKEALENVEIIMQEWIERAKELGRSYL